MLSCKDVTRLASQALDEPLGWRQRWGIQVHLLLCRACRRYVRELRFLERVLRQAAVEGWRNASAHKLSERARARIRKALERETQP